MNIFFDSGRFFNHILTLVPYLENVSRIHLVETGLAWPVGDRPMCFSMDGMDSGSLPGSSALFPQRLYFRIVHLKSCEPRTVGWSTVYWTIVHVLDWFKYRLQIAINGFLTANAGWGVYCFVVRGGGGIRWLGAAARGSRSAARRMSNCHIFSKFTPRIVPDNDLIYNGVCL